MKLITAVSHDEKTVKKSVDKKLVDPWNMAFLDF